MRPPAGPGVGRAFETGAVRGGDGAGSAGVGVEWLAYSADRMPNRADWRRQAGKPDLLGFAGRKSWVAWFSAALEEATRQCPSAASPWSSTTESDLIRPASTSGGRWGLVDVVHFQPGQAEAIPRTGFDLYLSVDDDTAHRLPDELRPRAYWAIDTHLDFAARLRRAEGCDLVFAAQRDGAERLRAAGVATAEWLPLACDPAIHRPHDVARDHDVAFVGNIFPGPRDELLQSIAARVPRALHRPGVLRRDGADVLGQSGRLQPQPAERREHAGVRGDWRAGRCSSPMTWLGTGRRSCSATGCTWRRIASRGRCSKSSGTTWRIPRSARRSRRPGGRRRSAGTRTGTGWSGCWRAAERVLGRAAVAVGGPVGKGEDGGGHAHGKWGRHPPWWMRGG